MGGHECSVLIFSFLWGTCRYSYVKIWNAWFALLTMFSMQLSHLRSPCSCTTRYGWFVTECVSLFDHWVCISMSVVPQNMMFSTVDYDMSVNYVFYWHWNRSVVSWMLLVPFLYTTTMFAVLQSSGTSPLFMDDWYILYSIAAISGAHSFITFVGMIFGPFALLGSRAISSFATPHEVIAIAVMIVVVCAGRFGMLNISSSVKTDPYCLLSTWALPTVSITSFLFSFKVGTPTWYLHLDLMYCQNLFPMDHLFWSILALKSSIPRT